MKVAQYLLEGGIALLLIWAVLTQVMMPAIRGTKLFPFFRKEEKIKKDIYAAKTAYREEELEAELKDERQRHVIRPYPSHEEPPVAVPDIDMTTWQPTTPPSDAPDVRTPTASKENDNGKV